MLRVIPAVFSLALLVASCSGKECPPGHFGPDCQECTCQNGTCNDGINGNGKCSDCFTDTGWSGDNCDQCTGNYWGESCNKKPTCMNGTPSLGIDGSGKCSDCFTDTGWSGDDCDQCTGNYWGESCDKKPTCVNGTPILGIDGSGKCSDCFTDTGWSGDNCDQCRGKYWGENCDKKPTCVNGAPSLGIDGNGKCFYCFTDTAVWGQNCEKPTCMNGTPSLGIDGNGKCTECLAGTAWSGDNCDQCPLTEGKIGTLIDSNDNNKTYKTIVINCREWMAENYQRETGTYYVPRQPDTRFYTSGLLYDWPTATSNNFCPSGWHLPTKAEFDALLNYVGSNNSTRSENLRATTWGNGLDKYGFTALPVAIKELHTHGPRYGGSGASFWSSTEYASKPDWYAHRLHIDESTAHTGFSELSYALSVRCIKDIE